MARTAALALVASAVTLIALAPPAIAGTPFQDPSARGVIGLCDRAGHPVTHGDINSKPFVWRAVSSQPAQAPYNAAGKTATLYAYQPQQELPPGDWSGDALTASSRYTDAAHPMAQGTSGDLSLKQFMGEFRPMWNGLLQLRIFLGAPDQAGFSLNYPATTIQVTGNTWHVVAGGNVACGSGRAVSIESILLPNSAAATKLAKPASRASDHASTKPIASSASAAKSGADATSIPSATALQAAQGSRDHSMLTVGIPVAAVVALVAAGAFLNRRRRGRVR